MVAGAFQNPAGNFLRLQTSRFQFKIGDLVVERAALGEQFFDLLPRILRLEQGPVAVGG